MDVSFDFAGVEQRGEFLFALVHVTIDPGPDSIGCANIDVSVPVANRDQSLAALREESLALARATIQSGPLVAWITEQAEHAHSTIA
jgi:hypothetical protein